MTDETREQVTDVDSEPEEAPPLNREQRRAERFGRRPRDVPQDNLQSQSVNNPRSARSDQPTDPAFGQRGAAVHDAVAGSPDQGQTDLTGPGTGGATESGDRLAHHEGMPSPQNQPNS